MRDFYNDGYEDGYGSNFCRGFSERVAPETDYDRASYKRSHDYGRLRRKLSDELDRENGWDRD